MYGTLPGTSGEFTGRTAPPPFFEYENMWISPAGPEKLGLKSQPSTRAHQAFVAAGSRLARSVCVIHPYRPRVNLCFIGTDFLAGAFRDACRARGLFFGMISSHQVARRS